MKRKFSHIMIFNCWLFVASLLLRRRVVGIVVNFNSIFPHAMGITRTGRIVHFRWVNQRARCRVSPVGRGQPELIRESGMDYIRTRKLVIRWD